MTLMPEPIAPEPAEESIQHTLDVVARDDDPSARSADAVTDCGVTPGHNRLEDRDGA